jgi:hypothetical protein
MSGQKKKRKEDVLPPVRSHRSGYQSAYLKPEPPPDVQYKSLSREYVNSILEQYRDEKLTPRQAQAKLGVGKTYFYKKISEFNDNSDSVIKIAEGDTNCFIAGSFKEEIIKDLEMRNLGAGGFEDGDAFLTYLKPYIRRTWKMNGIKDADSRDIRVSKSWINDMMSVYLPAKMSRADRQNRARLLKRLKVVVSIIQAAVSYAAQMGPSGLLYPHDPLAVPPDLAFNVDFFAMKLQDAFNKVRCII